MFASKIKLNDDVSHQKSTCGKILEWMQDHPSQCKNTNATVMAKSMEMGGVGPVHSLRQAIQRMVNSQMLNRVGNKKRSNFYINYLHKDIPPYVLENAPEDAQKTREEIEKGLGDDQYIDKVGCVVTKKPKAPKKEAKKEPKEEPKEIEKVDDEEYPELDSIIEELNVPVLVRKEEKSGGTNVSITLNLNIR